jgi:hypothetical protein
MKSSGNRNPLVLAMLVVLALVGSAWVLVLPERGEVTDIVYKGF